ncbi:hypothetical protein ACFOLD_01695 [Kocuria carniphila]|uniref:hypothetical protein n=1 Tax=Kocuria carniphila TaxID=262208 RepID=UPI00360CB274
MTGSVVVVWIGSSRVAESVGGHIGPEVGVGPADGTARPSYFPPIRPCRAVSRLDEW